MGVATFPSEQGSHRVNDAATLYKAKKVLQVLTALSAHCADTGATWKSQAQHLQRELAKIMRRFGRQCRGQGHVFVSLARQTQTLLLSTGQAVAQLAQIAQAYLQRAAQLTEEQRARFGATGQEAVTQVFAALPARGEAPVQWRCRDCHRRAG